MKKILHFTLVTPAIMVLILMAEKYCVPQDAQQSAPVAQTPAPKASVPQTPAAPDPALETKKQELRAKAIDEERKLEDRKAAIDALLKIDSRDMDAIIIKNQIKKAMDDRDKETAAQEQRKAEEDKGKQAQLEKAKKADEAIASIDNAILRGDLASAEDAIKSLDPKDPRVKDRLMQIANGKTRNFQNRLGLGIFGAALLAGLAALIVRGLRRKRMAFRVMDGVDAGYVFPIEQPRVRVGSNPDLSEIVITDDSHRISRVHFELFRSGNRYFIRDLSSNGTKVNDRPLSRGETAQVKPGDVISLADAARLEFFAAGKEVLQQANAGGV